MITEYNPLHHGHAAHLKLSKEISACDAVIAVMSGNFVQRGEPAICDKWKRAKMALYAGVDLVIELPFYYATAGAEYFARGAVTLLEKTGLVDCICFGSEWADIDALKECAQALLTEDEAYKMRLRKFLQAGFSYPAARAKAADITIPDTPNNILGIEYLKALSRIGSEITAYTVPRSPGSAKEIRDKINKEGDITFAAQRMPPYAWGILQEAAAAYGLADLDNYSSIFHYILQNLERSKLHEFADVSEGLENRLIQCARHNMLISDIIAAAKTKRYTYLRLQRAVLHIILGIKRENMNVYEAAGGPQYVRVLGFKQERVDLLRLLKKKSALPMVINLKNAGLPPLAAQMLEEEIHSTKLYSLAFPKHVRLNEFSMPLVIMD